MLHDSSNPAVVCRPLPDDVASAHLSAWRTASVVSTACKRRGTGKSPCLRPHQEPRSQLREMFGDVRWKGARSKGRGSNGQLCFFYYFKGFLNFETTRVRFFAFEENVWWDINLVWILSANLSNYMQIVIVIRMKFGIELVNLIHDNWERSRRFFEVSTYLRCSNINSSNRCFVSWKILTAILTISVRRPTQDILSRPCLYQSALNRFGQVLREFFQKPCFTSKRTSHDMKITNLKMTPISLHLFILGASGRK